MAKTLVVENLQVDSFSPLNAIASCTMAADRQARMITERKDVISAVLKRLFNINNPFLVIHVRNQAYAQGEDQKPFRQCLP